MKLHTENFEIEVYAPEQDGSQYGWFNVRFSDNNVRDAVGLWFYDGKLRDYDEIGDDIPKEVLDELEAIGFDVEDMRPYQVAA